MQQCARERTELPKSVNLCGIMYRIQQHEGIVSFKQDIECWDGYNQFTFELRSHCWYVNINSRSGLIMASHILKAYELLCDTFGDNHEVDGV